MQVLRPEPRLSQRVAGELARRALVATMTMRFPNIGFTAVLARLLSQDDFGVFAVALAVYLVVASLAELGMASAIARSTASQMTSLRPSRRCRSSPALRSAPFRVVCGLREGRCAAR